MQYPQLVHFSGHSHYPISDPRSLWQGEFTAIGTGSLYYVELTVEDVRTYHPENHKGEAQYWIVEVDANNRVRLIGIDLEEEKVLVEYILDNPANPANREYTPEKQAERSTAPVFADGAEITVKKSFGKISLTAPAAASTDGMPIFLYRVFVYDAQGNEILKDWILPDYYSATVSETNTFELGKLSKGDYTAKIIAETAYGIQSDPIEVSFSK